MKTVHFLATAALSAVAPWVTASPLDSGSDVPRLQYESAFAGYRPFDETPRADWREVNRVVDEAARSNAGGHAGHGAVPASPAPAATTPNSRPSGGEHRGHSERHGDKR